MEKTEKINRNKTINKNLIFNLPSGRKIGYAFYGAPNGSPVFAFHGTPGSRLWFTEDDDESKLQNIKLITVDRPGYGLSTPVKGRSILDFADDVNALADHLNIHKYAVLGISGGSVYSLACAYRSPDRVIKSSALSSIVPFINGRPPKQMCAENRSAFFLSKHFPFLSKWILNKGKKMISKDPDKYIHKVKSQVGHLCPSDRELIQKEEAGNIILINMKEATRQSANEGATEPSLLSKPWGFEPRNIQIPVEIWHGIDDTLTPIDPVKNYYPDKKNFNLHFLPGKGHFLDGHSDTWREILKNAI
ncbi:alpha/beta hydrolase [Mangrovivirga sp. M17]|uniref:Alpha/beta hydrolase n=1 Tax=Mangrovivirga halotolerans TaxID=2993936 RepID=A0ABT3RN65_9BACT|nr:alpha/beta hydrolase [Mangrovivirga halotolerans]MCX2743258.1 alpha/beta hydrolase [Mangrovivirga halotolerans]